METEKEKWIGIGATLLFHTLLICSLLFIYLTPPSNKRLAEEMLGIPVMFGNVPDAYGDNEPNGREKETMDLRLQHRHMW